MRETWCVERRVGKAVRIELVEASVLRGPAWEDDEKLKLRKLKL
jgi:hypothetical protein